MWLYFLVLTVLPEYTKSEVPKPHAEVHPRVLQQTHRETQGNSDTRWIPCKLLAGGDSVSTLDCTTFLSITSCLSEAGFWLLPDQKQVLCKNQCGTGSEGGGVQEESKV